jgi:hypothetical protein
MLGRRVSGAFCGPSLLDGRSRPEAAAPARGWVGVRVGASRLEGRSLDRVEGVARGATDPVPPLGATRSDDRSRSPGVMIRPDGRAVDPVRPRVGATLAPELDGAVAPPRRTSLARLAGAIRPEGRDAGVAVRSWAIRVVVGLAVVLAVRRTAVRVEARYPGSSLYRVDRDNGEGR